VLGERFGTPAAGEESAAIMEDLARWFPNARNHRLWGDREKFHAVVRKGCWPLSPYATWMLFHLSAGGKHLQGRSALALLGEAMKRHANATVPASLEWELAPAQLWSDALQQELIGRRRGGNRALPPMPLRQSWEDTAVALTSRRNDCCARLCWRQNWGYARRTAMTPCRHLLLFRAYPARMRHGLHGCFRWNTTSWNGTTHSRCSRFWAMPCRGPSSLRSSGSVSPPLTTRTARRNCSRRRQASGAIG
jgi:hypothetical protein